MKNFRGFTLVELMIVAAIIGILGLIAVPTSLVMLPKYKLKKAATEIASTMRKARSVALRQRQDITLAFNLNGSYTLNGQPALPDNCKTTLNECYGSGIEFGIPGSSSDPITFDGDKITFTAMGYPKGTNTNKWVYLRNSKGGGYRIGVAGIAGSIRMEQCGDTGVTCP